MDALFNLFIYSEVACTAKLTKHAPLAVYPESSTESREDLNLEIEVQPTNESGNEFQISINRIKKRFLRSSLCTNGTYNLRECPRVTDVFSGVKKEG